MIKIKKLYEIECETFDVVIKELNKAIEKVCDKKENEEFNIILEDMIESVSATEQLIKDYKINAGMTTLRNSFELIVTYIAVIKNEKHRINYWDIKKKRNIKAFSEEISKEISIDIYEETYHFLCEFAHPTILRNYFCDVSKFENGLEINRCIGMFFMIMIVYDYITYLNIFELQDEDLEMNTLLLLMFSAFSYFLGKYKINTDIIKKYEVIFGTEEEKEMLEDKRTELKDFIIENNAEIVKKLTESMNKNRELKLKIIEYVKN